MEKPNPFENAFKDEDVATFTKFLNFIDDHARFEFKTQTAYDYCNLRNQMFLIRKKCSDHVMEHLKTVKAEEPKEKVKK